MRHARCGLAVFVLLGASSSACLFDSERPGGTTIACQDDGDCSSSQQCVEGFCAAPDVVPPGQIVDLDVDLAATTDTSLTLVFTAPGDDGNGGGRPRGYRVTLTAAEIDLSPVVVDFAATAQPREREGVVVDGLLRGTVYSVVVEATDKVGQTTASTPLLAETGGALCEPDPTTGALTARGDQLTITRPEHLVRLYGCEVIEGSLEIVDQDCEITQLVALRRLRAVNGNITITSNELCGRGLVDLSDLATLERVGEFAVRNTGTLVAIDLDLSFGKMELLSNRRLRRVALGRRDDDPDFLLRVVGNPALERIDADGAVGAVEVERNRALTTLALPELQAGSLRLRELSSLAVVEAPQWVGRSVDHDGELVLDTLPVLEDLGAPRLTTLRSLLLHDVALDDLTTFATLTAVDTIDIADDDVAACDVFAFAARTGTFGEDVFVPRVDEDGDGVVDVDQRSCDPSQPMPLCRVLVPEHMAACGELIEYGDVDLQGQSALRAPNLRTMQELRIDEGSITSVDLPLLTTLRSLNVGGRIGSSFTSLTSLRLPRLTTVQSGTHLRQLQGDRACAVARKLTRKGWPLAANPWRALRKCNVR